MPVKVAAVAVLHQHEQRGHFRSKVGDLGALLQPDVLEANDVWVVEPL